MESFWTKEQHFLLYLKVDRYYYEWSYYLAIFKFQWKGALGRPSGPRRIQGLIWLSLAWISSDLVPLIIVTFRSTILGVCILSNLSNNSIDKSSVPSSFAGGTDHDFIRLIFNVCVRDKFPEHFLGCISQDVPERFTGSIFKTRMRLAAGNYSPKASKRLNAVMEEKIAFRRPLLTPELELSVTRVSPCEICGTDWHIEHFPLKIYNRTL